MRSETADAVGRPVGGDRLSDDPPFGHRSPEPAVVRVSSIVAHHEPVSRGDLDGRGEVALRARGAGFYVGVLLAHAVARGCRLAVDVTFLDIDFIARASDDALDEGDARLFGDRL